MEWVSSAIGLGGLVVGAFWSWLITRWYYKKSTKDQVKLFGKLSEDVRKAILENPNDDIRHEELTKIIEELGKAPIDTSRLQGPINGGQWEDSDRKS